MNKGNATTDVLVRLYDRPMTAARSDFAGTRSLGVLMSRDVNGDLLECFLINFCAFGVGMTEPVEGWIRRAGERCKEVGLPDLGRMLQAHAAHEAGHHNLMIDDTNWLVGAWNKRHRSYLNADRALHRPLPRGVVQYRRLHEEVIASREPYCQLAIEYEIESLSNIYGPPLMRQCQSTLGMPVVSGLSFLREHIAVDVGHTALNRRALETLLSEHAEFADALVCAGSRALRAYATFLDDCLEFAYQEIEGSDDP